MSPDDARPDPTPSAGVGSPASPAGVRQLRLVVTADDYAAALAFYRDALGLPELGAFTDPDGQVTILDAGRATLEITDAPHAAYVDRVEGVPAGRATAAPRVRVAFEVTDAHGVTRRLEGAGARVVAEPVRTPWDSLNARLAAPGDLQLTLFQELGSTE